MDFLQNVNTSTLSQFLMKGYDFVHFEAPVLHHGSLILGCETISPAGLATVLGGRNVKCALFMACNSANVIGALHATDIPYVIAATGDLYTDYCEQFCRAFYTSVSKGFSLPDAFAHANVVSSQAVSSRAIEPFRDLRREGNLSLSVHMTSAEELTFRSSNLNR